jgi:hypothetical protein
MSQLIHVGTNRLSDKEYTKILKNINELFDEKYPDSFEDYFQHIPLEALKSKNQEKIKEALKYDVIEYAFNMLTPEDTKQPILRLSGLGGVKIVRQSPYNPKFPDPSWEFEAKDLNNLNSCITIIWHLNDIEKKGELEFYFQKTQIRPSSKELIIFPSYFTHSHKFHPSDKEKIFLITTFYIGG